MDKSAFRIYITAFLWYNTGKKVTAMIYNGKLQDTTNYFVNEWIAINSCNTNRNNGQAFTVIRKDGRVDYHILYVAGGSCVCLYDGRESVLRRGDFVLYPPDTEQRYTLPDGIDSQTLWLHFTGTCVTEILRELKLSGGVSHAAAPDETEQFFKYMIHMNSINSAQSRMFAKGYLLNLLASLAKNDFDKKPAMCLGTVQKMLEYIHTNWQKNIRVADVAHAACLCESRAAHSFRQSTGESIGRYLEKLRLSEAKRLLMNTDMNISEISAMVGYNDPFYFSRKFKVLVGCSPKEYRSMPDFRKNSR